MFNSLASVSRHILIGAGRVILGICLGLAFILVSTPLAFAEAQTWVDVADEMEVVLMNASSSYEAQDPEAAKAYVNDAYFSFYEKLGFEKTVMASISGDRAAEVEYSFSQIKKQITANESLHIVKSELQHLSDLLHEDARMLDGEQSNPYASFLQAFFIILREGFEAIIVVAAILAALVKAGDKDKNVFVYLGVVAALVASALLAWLFNAVTALSGANQEIIEGATVLVAVAMLIYVTSWLLSKAETEAWNAYIKRKTSESVKTGSFISLAFVAFLTVFREGAEVILFYQALLANSATDVNQLWFGLGIGLIVLVGVYLAIRFLSIKIPLRPFFLAISIVLAVMAISFAGSGIKEFQEAGAVEATLIPGVPSFDLLGFYPTAETLIAQGITALLLLIFLLLSKRNKKIVADESAT